MKTTFLYTLSDPETGKIRYLGKSDNPFKRYRKHLTDKSLSHKTNWIQGLKIKGFVPYMDLLDEIPVSQWQFWEREYIRVFRAIGMDLVNTTDGGDGNHNPSEDTREKNRRAHLGTKNPHAGVPRSPESRAKMSMYQSSLEGKEKNRQSKLGRKNPHKGVPRSKESREKQSATIRARKEGATL